jgi:hypothetical protein
MGQLLSILSGVLWASVKGYYSSSAWCWVFRRYTLTTPSRGICARPVTAPLPRTQPPQPADIPPAKPFRRLTGCLGVGVPLGWYLVSRRPVRGIDACCSAASPADKNNGSIAPAIDPICALRFFPVRYRLEEGRMRNMGAPVDRDQFKVDDHGITHEPTGYTFTAHPERPTDGFVRPGQVGRILPNGEYYHPNEIEDMARRLWLEQLARQW